MRPSISGAKRTGRDKNAAPESGGAPPPAQRGPKPKPREQPSRRTSSRQLLEENALLRAELQRLIAFLEEISAALREPKPGQRTSAR